MNPHSDARIIDSWRKNAAPWTEAVRGRRIATDDPAKAAAFYEAIFGLDIIMDHGWLRTYSSGESMTVQLGVASQGGSDTPVPDLSIEVDDLDAVLERVQAANVAVAYGPVGEPWGVRRFFVRDPFGKIVNVLQHR